MDVGSKAKKSHSKDQNQERLSHSYGGGGSMRRGVNEEARAQFEDLKDHNRLLRNQLQAVQVERDESNHRFTENVNNLWKKVEELKREKMEMQKVLEQKSWSQRNQASVMDHEKLAKHYEQMCSQLKILKHDKEQLEQRYRQEKQGMESRLQDSLQSTKLREEAEQDRDNLRYKLSEKKRELDRLYEQLSCLTPNQEASKREITKILEDRDALKAKLTDMKQERHALQDKLSSANTTIESLRSSTPVNRQVSELQLQVASLQQQLDAVRKERDEMVESSNELTRSVGIMEAQLKDTEGECQMLRQTVVDLQRGISPNHRRISDGRCGSNGSLHHEESDEMFVNKRYRNSIYARISQGSTDEESFVNSDASDQPRSLTDLTSISRSNSLLVQNVPSGSVLLPSRFSGLEKVNRKKLGTFSSSTSSLCNESQDLVPSGFKSSERSRLLIQKVLRLEKSLEETKKKNGNLQSKMTDIERERSEASMEMCSTKKDLELARNDLAVNGGKLKTACSQLSILSNEKGVAMRDNAASYERSLQFETKVRELTAEMQIMEQQRDIAKKELERVITDSVTNKKKLETIKAQRQKDAKDLSAMRHLKDKAVQEMNDHQKKMEELVKSQTMLEEEAATVKDIIHRAGLKISMHSRPKGGGTSSFSSSMQSWNGGGGEGSGDGGSTNLMHDLGIIIDRLHHMENEKKVIVKKLFRQDSVDQNYSLADILHWIESMIQEKDDLVMELDAIQQSSSKLNESRIFELKQMGEDTMLENRNLKREISSLSQHLVKSEQKRDQLSTDCERLDLQYHQLKSRHTRLVEDHDKTLDRVTERWKQNWPIEWDDAWEEKHVMVSLDSEGLAGFSVVGGRDQPQLPNPGAFIITVVNPGGPAEGLLKAGDVLESLNGISLSNADHREAVRAVKESKRNLSIVVKRRRHAYPINMGIVQPITSMPQLTPMSSGTPTNTLPSISEQLEQLEYSLYITGKEKSDLGFKYNLSMVCTVSDVTSLGPADQILERGDRIVKVNNSAISHEKPSVVKKLMKPHKNIIRLTIERPSRQDRTFMGQTPLAKDELTSCSMTWSPNMEDKMKQNSWSENRTAPIYPSKGYPEAEVVRETSHASYPACSLEGMRAPPSKEDYSGAVAGGEVASRETYFKSRSRGSSCSRGSREDYSQDTQSQDSSNKPMKLMSVVTCVKNREKAPKEISSPKTTTRPSSDGVIYGNFNERRIEYEDVILTETSDSQYSQSESYLSESSYDYGLSSSQSIDLTFHTNSSIPTHNRLTVDTMMTTQVPTQPQQPSEDEDGGVGFLSRDDPSRTTFRTRNSGDPTANSNANNSEVPGIMPGAMPGSTMEDDTSQETDGCPSYSQEFGRERRGYGLGIRRKSKQKSQTNNGSLTKLSSSYQNLSKMSTLGLRGRSRSNLSLGCAPSMTSVTEEPRRSTSIANMHSLEYDPLADATYIRANFTYIPRTPKELAIKTGDVFHIHDEAPSKRFRSSFWVSRLNPDGTDEQIGAIPNSMRGQEYLSDQGESLEFSLYEEVEAYTGRRPVVIMGALADQVMSALLESFPNIFYQCHTEYIEGAVRLNEARLRREMLEKKIIDFFCTEGGFEVIKLSSITNPPCKHKHCLMTGSPHALQTLKTVAPPISIFIKAMTAESITTFSPEHVSYELAKEIYDNVTDLEENHANEFTASLFLIYMDTLMGQIEDIIREEKKKQAWVPVSRQDT